jgi:hypothetical protein
VNTSTVIVSKLLQKASGWDDTPFVWAGYHFSSGVPAGYELKPRLASRVRDPKHYIAAYDLGYLWRMADEMAGNEFAVGYNDSGYFWHFRWGQRGAGNMIDGIGQSWSAEDGLSIEDSFCTWLIYLLEGVKR